MVSTVLEIDPAQTGAFAGKVLGDISAGMTLVLAALGDRLGLFQGLAATGPASPADLAARTGVHERYAREWLGGMAAAGYVEYDPAGGRFSLPPAHIPVLAQEGGPFFAGGGYQLFLAEIGQIGRVTEAFRTGRGVPFAAYGDALLEGQERFSRGWIEHQLTQIWVPALPAVQTLLEHGAAVADIGCGSGRALIQLAHVYPTSYFVGYDTSAAAIARAEMNARQAGLTDRVRFQQLDATGGLPARYDVITTFEVVHDAVDPPALLRAIRQALTPAGRYVCVDMNCSDKLEENFGPLGTMLHGISILYCLSTSLSDGGPGLGTLGLPEPRLRALAAEAGFAALQRIPIEDPFHALYELLP